MKLIDIVKIGEEKAAAIAAKAVLKGEVIVVPTDTVYGLAADAANRKAVSKVFKVKSRKPGKPLPIFVKNIAMAKKVARISARQERVMRLSWPGKATFVVYSKGTLAQETGTLQTIGLRQPNHSFLALLLEKTGRPLTGTSANLAGKAPIGEGKRAKEVFKNRKEKPSYIFDMGKLPASSPSSVVDITKSKARTIR